MDRIERARRTARVIVAVGLAPVALVAFTIYASPTFFGPPPPPLWSNGPFLLGVMGIVVGFALMLRIYRSAFHGERPGSRTG